MKASKIYNDIKDMVLLSPSAEEMLRKYISSLGDVTIDNDIKKVYRYTLYFPNGERTIVSDVKNGCSDLLEGGFISKEEYDACVDFDVETEWAGI